MIRCIESLCAHQDAGCLAWSALIECHLMNQSLRKIEAKMIRETVKKCTRSLVTLENALTTFLKMNDFEGVHESCRLIWNTGRGTLVCPVKYKKLITINLSVQIQIYRLLQLSLRGLVYIINSRLTPLQQPLLTEIPLYFK